MSKKLQAQIDAIKKSIVNKNVTNASMATYGKLNKIGHSLYRYGQLSKAGLKDEAKTESTKANNLISSFNATEEGTVLKGGISNTRYVWVAEDGACDDCQAIDGTEYDNPDDAPIPLHPNCKCRIEEIADDEPNEPDDDDEPCDCVERLEALIQELEENAGDLDNIEGEAKANADDVEQMVPHVETMIAEIDEILDSLGEEYGQHLANCKNNIDAIYDEIVIKKQELQNLLTDILNLLDEIKSYLQVLAIFSFNFLALQYEAYILGQKMDKYRHSVANCQSAQLGELEEEVAKTLSDKKELFDQYHNIYAITHRVSEKEALEDSEKDQIVNRLGRKMGRINPTCDCRIMMQDLKNK